MSVPRKKSYKSAESFSSLSNLQKFHLTPNSSKYITLLSLTSLMLVFSTFALIIFHSFKPKMKYQLTVFLERFCYPILILISFNPIFLLCRVDIPYKCPDSHLHARSLCIWRVFNPILPLYRAKTPSQISGNCSRSGQPTCFVYLTLFRLKVGSRRPRRAVHVYRRAACI